MKEVIYILLMAVTTYVIRAVPFVVLKKKIKSRFIQSFLFYVPYAVLAAMTFPAILYSTQSVPSAAVGLGMAVLLAYKEKGLLTVAVFSCAAVYLTELLMRYL